MTAHECAVLPYGGGCEAMLLAFERMGEPASQTKIDDNIHTLDPIIERVSRVGEVSGDSSH